jgi:thiol-disulfide isomerase/thioredoxin
MKPALLPVVLVAASLVGACSKAPDAAPATTTAAAVTADAKPAPAKPTPAVAHAEPEIAWETGDVDAAFAKARSENKPLFLYWGASWCPPCNEVKATIFNRQDFAERARFFVPVYVDGDARGAQQLGARFKVSGYPTMVLFTPDGREITRLPGEVDADQYMRVLALGMNGARPVKETLNAALAGAKDGSGLRAEDWRMLAYYSWETDESQLLPEAKRAATLARLAKACPAAHSDIATRLALSAIVAGATAKDAKPRSDASAVTLLVAVLADPAVTRENFDVLVNYAGKVTDNVTLKGASERARLTSAWKGALDRLYADTRLSALDRLAVLSAEIDLAKVDDPKGSVPPALQQRVRAAVAQVDRDTQDPYSRQAVISDAAQLLAEADLMAESDALLTAELSRSQSPYYYMLGLADNAKTRGDNAAALDWAQKAYEAAKGPATRLQWGVRYVNMLTDLAPADGERIEGAARQVIGELEPAPETFYERNQRALEKMSRKLAAWNKGDAHRATITRLRAEMAGVCGKLPAKDPARATCERTLQPAPAASA